jgi:hypothetical protein
VAGAEAFGVSSEAMRTILAQLDIDLKRRGETLRVAEFVAVSNKVAGLREVM